MLKILYRLFLLIIFVGVLGLIISYARGYRINVLQKGVTSTGILVASSFPDGAKVYINGILKGATNTNITLTPGKYEVEIKKEGYTPWKKSITVKGEIVIKTDSLLFPQNPSLSPLTSLGVMTSKFSPTTNRIIFISNNSDVEKDAVYLLENSPKALSLFNPLKILALKSALPTGVDLTKTQFIFSPDGKQVIMSLCEEEAVLEPLLTPSPTVAPLNSAGTCEIPLYTYLLSTDVEKQVPLEITKSVDTIKNAWSREEDKNIQKILETYKDPLPAVASDSFKILSFSPDDQKVLYKATKNTTLPLLINPPLIGSNQGKESRTLVKDRLYIYDKKEDKNFEIPLQVSVPTQPPISVTPSLTQDLISLDDIQNKIIWYPDSRHLIINENKQVSVIDYDGGNRQTIYSGPFENNFLGVSTEGNLLIIANLNPNANKYPDIYTVGIR